MQCPNPITESDFDPIFAKRWFGRRLCAFCQCRPFFSNQVKRLICVTGFGAGDSRGHGRVLYNVAFHLLLGRVYDDKDVQERIVRRSKLDWVIVRPVILTDGPKTKAYRALVDPRDERLANGDGCAVAEPIADPSAGELSGG